MICHVHAPFGTRLVAFPAGRVSLHIFDLLNVLRK
jgi:hypothetical protein